MSLMDPIYQLTERELKRLRNSWAEKFSSEIFPLINEERFSVLYSNNPASRPNNPVNVYVGLLILKEIFSQSDEECLDSLMFDIRYQYALHTTSFKEQPVSKNSLTNFRTAVYRYNEEHGVDLIQEEIESHAKKFAELLNIDGRMIRMDSLMISSSCKKLSRLEIIYSCVERIIKEGYKKAYNSLPDKFRVYLEEGHRNDIIYRSKSTDLDSKLKTITADGIELYYILKGTDVEETEEFKLLSRMLGEQTQLNEGKLELRLSKEISPESLQNPTDPDATYRRKGTKEGIGYVANIVESFDDRNKIILQYDMQRNTYSDQQFCEDVINKLGKQTEELITLADGAYYSEELYTKARKNNINLIPTNLTGRSQSSEKTGYEDFEIDETNHEVKACPMKHKPLDSRYKNGVYRAHFENKICDACPNRGRCPVHRQKKSSLLEVSETKLHRLKLMNQMNTEEYKKLAGKRAGVEAIPSVLRRRYSIDHMPVRGLVRSKVWLGLKIAAINCKRLIKGLINRTGSPLFYTNHTHLLEVLYFQRSTSVKVAA